MHVPLLDFAEEFVPVLQCQHSGTRSTAFFVIFDRRNVEIPASALSYQVVSSCPQLLYVMASSYYQTVQITF